MLDYFHLFTSFQDKMNSFLASSKCQLDFLKYGYEPTNLNTFEGFQSISRFIHFEVQMVPFW